MITSISPHVRNGRRKQPNLPKYRIGTQLFAPSVDLSDTPFIACSQLHVPPRKRHAKFAHGDIFMGLIAGPNRKGFECAHAQALIFSQKLRSICTVPWTTFRTTYASPKDTAWGVFPPLHTSDVHDALNALVSWAAEDLKHHTQARETKSTKGKNAKKSPKAKTNVTSDKPLNPNKEYGAYDDVKRLLRANHQITSKHTFQAAQTRPFRTAHSMPSNPQVTYGSEWEGWNRFCNTTPPGALDPKDVDDESLLDVHMTDPIPHVPLRNLLHAQPHAQDAIQPRGELDLAQFNAPTGHPGGHTNIGSKRPRMHDRTNSAPIPTHHISSASLMASYDSTERIDRQDRFQRLERMERLDRQEWFDRQDRMDRQEQMERRERQDRIERQEREDRRDRLERSERLEREDRRYRLSRGFY